MNKTKLFTIGAIAAMSISMSACGGSANSDNNAAGEETAEQQAIEESAEMKSLRQQVEQLNASMPIDMQGGLKMTNVTLSDNYLTFTCEYPASLDFEVPADEATKKSIVGSLPSATIKMLQNAGLGIKYIYAQEGSDNKQELDVTPEEIKAL